MPFYHEISTKKDMGKFGFDRQFQAIVIGGVRDEFVRHASRLLGDYEVEFVVCEDVYSAVAESAKNRRGAVFVVGRLEQLGREQGRFFHIALKNGCRCCCLVDRSRAQRRGQIRAAKEAGAFVINEPAEIKEAITEWLSESSVSSSGGKENDRASAFLKDEFLTTKAELDALLGT